MTISRIALHALIAIALVALPRGIGADDAPAPAPAPKASGTPTPAAGLSFTDSDLKPFTQERLEDEASGKRTDPVEGSYYRGAPKRRRSRRVAPAPTPFKATGVQTTTDKRADKVDRRAKERAEQLNSDTGLKRHIAEKESKKRGRTVSPDEITMKSASKGRIYYTVGGKSSSED